MRGRTTLVTLGAVLAVFVGVPAAQAAPPVIVNSGNAINSGNASWVESPSSRQESRSVTVTFVVRHDPNQRITGVARDTDFNGTDNTASVGVTSVSAQFLGSGTTNFLASSVVRHTFTAPDPGGFSCGLFGGTRRRDVPLRFRVVDSTGERSGSVTQNWHVVEEDQCTGATDFAVLESVSQSATTAVPGQNVSFTFRCDDADSSGNNDRCDFIRWRWRRLNDGTTSGLTTQDAEDNTTRTFPASFPTRGIYVVEAQLCGEDDCNDDTDGSGTPHFWRIGSVMVNESTLPSGSISFAGVDVVAGPTPSVNEGDAATAVASVGSGGGTAGATQVIEWDADGNGAFERIEYTTPQLSGGNVIQADVAGADLEQAVDTSTHGLRQVRARAYDNGAIDAADNERRASVFAADLRVNARPVANDQSVTTDEDTPADIPLDASDADSQPAPLAYEIVSQPQFGTVELDDGNATYTPDPNYSGPDEFTYRVMDGPVDDAAWATSNTATVSIAVLSVNDAPVAEDQLVETDEDTPVGITLTGSDADGDSLTFQVVGGGPAHGTLECTGPNCTYTPDPNFHGADSFEFTASDGNGGSDTGRVDITVRPVNDAPIAEDRNIETDEDTPVDITLAATDPDGDSLSFEVLDGPQHGTLDCTGAACTYTPAPDYNGPDDFTFRASDGNGASDTGQVDITVRPVNDIPVADDQAVETDEDTPVDITLTGSDADGDPLTFQVVGGGPAHGTLECTGPSCTYTPAPGFEGEDGFDFSVSDGNGGTDTGHVAITVLHVNDPPVATSPSLTTEEDTPVTATLATDPDGDELTITLTGGPANGSVQCEGAECTYTPATDFFGNDSFTYTVSDGEGETDAGTATIDVTPVNDPPVAEDVEVATEEDTAVEIVLVATDVDDTMLDYGILDGPGHGTLTCDGALCTYEPDPDFNGTDSFVYRVRDPHGASDDGTVTITVGAAIDGTTMQASALIRLTDLGTILSIRYRAHLAREDNGAPIAGATITFTAGGQAACSAVTDANGNASCAWQITHALATLLGNGYDAVFAGDDEYGPSSAHGPFLGF